MRAFQGCLVVGLALAAAAGAALEPQSTDTAAVSGHVLDEKGEGVAGVPVQVWRRRTIAGLPQLVVAGGAISSADGSYSVSKLVAGNYIVVLWVFRHTVRVVVPRPSPCSPPYPLPLPPPDPESRPFALPPFSPPPRPGPPPRPIGTYYAILPREMPPIASDPTAPQTYQTVFFPGVTDPGQAATLKLRAGDTHANVDLPLRVVAATTIRGRLMRASGQKIGDATKVTLRLAGAPENYPEARAHFDRVDAFTFVDVPPGAYILEVSLEQSTSCDTLDLSAEDIVTRQGVEVPATGLSDLEIPIAEGLAIHGRIVFNGRSARPRNLAPVLKSVDFPDSWPELFADLEPERQTAFRIPGVAPGRYVMPANDSPNANWFVESITAGTCDLTNGVVVIDRTGLADIVLAMTDRPATLSGTVTASGQPGATPVVALFPSDPRLWQHAHPFAGRYRTVRAVSGYYQFASIVPGDYFVAVFDETRSDEWPDEPFLRALQLGAPRIRIARGSSQSLALTMPSVRR